MKACEFGYFITLKAISASRKYCMANPATRRPKILVMAVMILSPRTLNIFEEYMKKKYTMASTRSTDTKVSIFVIKSPFMSIITRDMAPGPASNGVANGTIPIFFELSTEVSGFAPCLTISIPMSRSITPPAISSASIEIPKNVEKAIEKMKSEHIDTLIEITRTLNIFDEYMKKKYTMASTRSTDTKVSIFVINSMKLFFCMGSYFLS